MATLGEALEAKGQVPDWRSQLRAAEVDRRPPPSQLGRPDRGYVDQSPPPSPPRRTVIPIERLQEAQRISAEEQPQRPFLTPPPPPERETRTFPPRSEPPPAPSESSVAAALSLLTASAEPAQNGNREAAPVATKKRTRKAWDPELKERVIKRILQAKEAEKGRDDLPVRTGTQKRIAEEEGVPEQLVSNWIHAWKASHKGMRWPGDIPSKQRASAAAPPAQTRTLMSRPSPDSLGGRSLDAIMAELKATQERVRELKAELREALSD